MSKTSAEASASSEIEPDTDCEDIDSESSQDGASSEASFANEIGTCFDSEESFRQDKDQETTCGCALASGVGRECEAEFFKCTETKTKKSSSSRTALLTIGSTMFLCAVLQIAREAYDHIRNDYLTVAFWCLHFPYPVLTRSRDCVRTDRIDAFQNEDSRRSVAKAG